MRPISALFLRPLVLVFSLLAALLLPLVVHAGNYDVTYSSDSSAGATLSVPGKPDIVFPYAPTTLYDTLPLPSSHSIPNIPNINGYGYSVPLSNPYQPQFPWYPLSTFTATMKGAMVATFTWNNHGDLNAFPPAVVTIREAGSIYWFYYTSSVGTSTESGSDGLGNSLVTYFPSPNGAVYFDTQDIVKQNPGPSFTVVLSPHVQFSAVCSGGSTPILDGLSIFFGASILPPCFLVSNSLDPVVLTANTTTPIPLKTTVYGPANKSFKVGLNVYDSVQNQIVSLPSQTCIIGSQGYGVISFAWNGLKADGTAAPPGVYLYQFSLIDSNGNVVDTDKSSFLLPITSPSANAVLTSDDGTTATYQVSYGLASTDSPPRSAAAGKVDVYDPNQTLIYTYTMQSGDLTPGQHTVSVPIPSPTLDGNSTFLVSA